jgi:hypothetical protein
VIQLSNSPFGSPGILVKKGGQDLALGR